MTLWETSRCCCGSGVSLGESSRELQYEHDRLYPISMLYGPKPKYGLKPKDGPRPRDGGSGWERVLFALKLREVATKLILPSNPSGLTSLRLFSPDGQPNPFKILCSDQDFFSLPTFV